MSVTEPKAEPLKKTASPSTVMLATGPARTTCRILAVVDNTARTNYVIDFIASLAAHGIAIETVVLNVQSKRDDHRLRGYQSFKRREIDDRLINDVGMPVIASVTRRLEKLGIAAQGRVEIGEPVDVILKRVAEEHCEMVVIGEERSNALCRFLARVLGIVFGSAASRTTLAECPVVFVQAPDLRSRRDAVQRG